MCNLGCFIVADVWSERCHQHERMFYIIRKPLLVGLYSFDQELSEIAACMREQKNGVDEIENNHRLKDVQLKISPRSCDGNSRVIPHHLSSHHHHRFALRRVDLAWHNGRTWFIFGEEQFG